MSAASASTTSRGIDGGAHGLVSGDRNLNRLAHLPHLLQGWHRLFDVLETEPCQDPDPANGGVDIPGRVGVDPDPSFGPEHLSDRLEPGEVGFLVLAGLGHLHLGRGGGRTRHDLRRQSRLDGGHGHVHRDAFSSG
jgi:hypothetical protein